MFWLWRGLFCRKVLILARLLASFFSSSCSKRVTRRIRETKHPLSANANRSVLIAAVSDQGLIILCIHFDFFIKYPCLKLAIMAFLLRWMTSTNFAWKRGFKFRVYDRLNFFFKSSEFYARGVVVVVAVRRSESNFERIDRRRGLFSATCGYGRRDNFYISGLEASQPGPAFFFCAKCNFVSLPPPAGNNKTKGAFAFRNQKNALFVVFRYNKLFLPSFFNSKKSVSQNLRWLKRPKHASSSFLSAKSLTVRSANVTLRSKPLDQSPRHPRTCSQVAATAKPLDPT